MTRALALLLVGCNGAGTSAAEPLARVGDHGVGPTGPEGVVDAAVVRMVAERDGVDEAQARARVADTLRAVAAAREAAAVQADEAPLVEPAREEHLRRAALARVWLEDGFEPDHEPQDIPDDAPLLQQAKATARYIHPRLHLLCQLVALPSGPGTTEEIFAAAALPAWKDAARARFDPVAQRMQRYVRADDRDACGLMQKLMQFEEHDADGVTLRVEAQAFDLDACAETAADGSCREPKFVPEWVEQVRVAEPPGFLPAFSTRFGWHLVFVQEILPERTLDDPQTMSWLRGEVHRQWQHEAFQEYIDRLRELRAVRIAPAAESPP
jgi:hypothetical protein